jgi:hypothetical protein
MLSTVFTLFVVVEVVLEITKINATSTNTQPVTLSNQILTLAPNSTYQFSRGPFGELRNEKTVNNYGFTSHRDFDRYAANETIALVGGSWVLADQVRMDQSIGSLLDQLLAADIYPVSQSDPNLAQNLGFIEFSFNELNVDRVIVLLVNDQLSGSFNMRGNGKRIFDSNGNLTIAADFVPSLLYRWVTSFNVANYLFKNIQVQRIFSEPGPQVQEVAPNVNEKLAKLASEYFINGLERTGIKPEDMLFVFAPNLNAIESGSDEGISSNFVELKEFLDHEGYVTLNLHDAFRFDYEQYGRHFLIPRDSHWNAYSQNLAAQLIANHPVFFKIERVDK